MVLTIVRIGYAGNDSKKKIRLLSGGFYLLGTTITAVLFGIILGFVGCWLWGNPIIQQPNFQVVATIGMLLYAGHEFGLISLPRPQLHRQVRRIWLALRPPWPAFIHGLGLGWGVTTFIPFTSFYFAILGAVATADPIASAWIMGLFGIARGLPILVLSLKHPAGKEVDELQNTIINARGLVAKLNGVVLVCGGTVLGIRVIKSVVHMIGM